MRLIALNNVVGYWEKHPETRRSLQRWVAIVKEQQWETAAEMQSSFSKAEVLNADRVRFETAGGDYRLIAACDFGRKIVFVKFIGTHNEYDRIDALTVAQF